MRAVPSLRRNVAFVSASALLSNAASAFTHWLIVRSFGIEVHGAVAWMLAVYWAIVTASDLGLASTVGLRDFAGASAGSPSARGASLVGPSLVTIGVSLLLSLVLVAFPGPLVEGRGLLTAASARWAALWVIGHAIIRACAVAALGLEQMGSELGMRLPLELGRAAAVVFVVLAGLDPSWLFPGWAVSTAIAAAIAVVSARTLLDEAGVVLSVPRPVLASMARLVRLGIPYFPAYLGTVGLPILLPMLGGVFAEGNGTAATAAVSVLQVCTSLALVPRLLSQPLSIVILVRLARLEGTEGGDEAGRKIMDAATRWTAAISATSIAGSVVLGLLVLGFLYGARYADHVSTLVILFVASGVDAILLQIDSYLKARDRAAVIASGEVLKLVSLVAVAAALGPRLGPEGIAWAALVAGVATLCQKVAALYALGASIPWRSIAVVLSTGAVSIATVGSRLGPIASVATMVGSALVLRLLPLSEIRALLVRDAGPRSPGTGG